MLLWVTQGLISEKENEIHHLLLFSRVAGPAGRRDLRICPLVKDNSTVNQPNPGVRILHAYLHS